MPQCPIFSTAESAAAKGQDRTRSHDLWWRERTALRRKGSISQRSPVPNEQLGMLCSIPSKPSQPHPVPMESPIVISGWP